MPLGVPRLVRAISDYTNIKKLHITNDSPYQRLKLFCPLMEVLKSLSIPSRFPGITFPAFFPCLRILEIDLCCDNKHHYISNYIEPLLLSIKSARPPNLKTIILNAKRVYEKDLDLRVFLPLKRMYFSSIKAE